MMLFSEDLRKGLGELQGFLPFAVSYDYNRVRPLLESADRAYIVPLLGEPLYNRLTGNMEEFPEEVKLCRKAVANIAVYQNFTLLNMQIIPGGFARLNGEGTSGLYKYQEEELKRTFRRNGFDTLDEITEYFFSRTGDFPEFKESDYYVSGRGEIVPDRFVVSKYYKPVSRLVFHHLQPFIRRAEELDAARLIDLHALRVALLSDGMTEKETRTLELLRPLLVNMAVAYAIDDMGVNITDTGVWLENRVAADGLPEQRNLGVSDAGALAGKYRQLAERYRKELLEYLSGTNRINPLIRDNNGKKTVWL